ncbi:hypothetical protein AGMMS49944_21040 [Spirochaetia bacterium]|nr:hypothetical protein AGMMS49944_21040 [Spirochaetia bacterium]
MAFSFFSWLISSITGGPNPERAKKRALKRMTKMLAANKYGNFYRVKTEEVTAELAQFFFKVYKTVSPAQTPLQNAAQSSRLRLAAIHAFLDQTQLAILEGLSLESIEKRAEEIPSGTLARQMQNEFDQFEEGFDPERVNAIDNCYTLILGMAKFVTYDFYFLLRKFDPQLRVFAAIPGAAVSDGIKDFLELTACLDTDRDWNMAFTVLRDFKGAEVVNPKLWEKMLSEIQEVKRSGILEMLVRFITKDPDWGWEPRLTRAHITGEYLESIRTEIFDHLNRITTAKQDARIAEYARQFFGDGNMDRLTFYTEGNSQLYKKRNFNGFVFARGLNYVIVFLTDEGAQLQFLSDLILVRGQWVAPALYRPLSESVRLLVSLPGKIKALDDSLMDQGSYGLKLERAFTKTIQSKSLIRNINANLARIDAEARLIITDAIFNLSVIADSLKDILEDYRRSFPLIILNWEELAPFSNGDLESQISGMHKRLDDLLDLLHLVVQDSDEDTDAEAER